MKALHQFSEIKISFKPAYNVSTQPKITTSKEAYELLLQCWDENTIELFEECKVILLNNAGRVLGILDHSKGGMQGTIVDPKIIFSVALKACAASIILAHNHPSGNMVPSKADIALTEKLRLIGELLEIPVLDHIIVGKQGYYSFADSYEI